MKVHFFKAIVVTFIVLLFYTSPLRAHGVFLQSGSDITSTLTVALSTNTNHNGDRFRLQAEQGFAILGHLRRVSSGGSNGKATMEIVIDALLVPGRPPALLRARIFSLTPLTGTTFAPTSQGAELFARTKRGISVRQGAVVRLRPAVPLPITRTSEERSQELREPAQGYYNGAGEMPF